VNSDLIKQFSIAGRLALVTGASSGLGRHFARLLADSGARVVVAARNAGELDALVEEISSAGGQARAARLDVTDPKSVHACFDAVADWGALDIVVNNAGVTVTKPLLEQTDDDFNHVIDTNLKGSWKVATEAARRMRAAGTHGSIVNIASILGERVASGVAPYAVSKAAVIQATKAMALELARYGIRVNALLPGYVATSLNRDFLDSEHGQKLRMRIPARRFGAMSDLDGPLLLLVSDAGRAMSGSTVAVDNAHLVSSL
jgi:NAD(P)-dependent dehydrogenase (short-subunit alcohol dehydrogenase family)